MNKILHAMGQLNFFAGLSVIATTILTVVFFLMYVKKISTPTDEFEKQPPVKEIELIWFAGLFCAELYGQIYASTTLDVTEAFFSTALNTAGNMLVFFICYKILSGVGVDKENIRARCNKAFIGMVIAGLALTLLIEYTETHPQNVPAVSQKSTWEFVTTFNHENVYIDRKTLVRIGDTHPDAAPEFKCVLSDDSGEQWNCEFHARGIVVMFMDGEAVGDSVSEPDIDKLYSAIVAKYF